MARTRRLSDDEILAQIPAAEARARKARRDGMRAVSVAYDDRQRRVTMELSNGYLFGFPVKSVPSLKTATPETLRAVRLSPSGAALHWDALNVDLEVAGLVVASMGREAQLRAFAKAAGSVTSERKAAAARANGAKGGRPRLTSSASRGKTIEPAKGVARKRR
jgi:hypothetical protein